MGAEGPGNEELKESYWTLYEFLGSDDSILEHCSNPKDRIQLFTHKSIMKRCPLQWNL